MTNQFNDLPIYRTEHQMIFVPLPREQWREAGRCDCDVCKGATGYWDTLAIPTDGRTYQVHAPKLQTGSAEVGQFKLQR